LTAEHLDITTLLNRARGAGGVPDELLAAVYAQLHSVAATLMRREDPGHTLQPTILVHEAWMRLAGQKRATWESRAQFISVAARVMRRMLVNHARDRGAAKRGGAFVRRSLDAIVLSFEERSLDVAGLDRSLQGLAAEDALASRVVELRFFGGMSLPEIAREEGVSVSTIKRAWVRARLWLKQDLGAERPPG